MSHEPINLHCAEPRAPGGPGTAETVQRGAGDRPAAGLPAQTDTGQLRSRVRQVKGHGLMGASGQRSWMCQVSKGRERVRLDRSWCVRLKFMGLARRRWKSGGYFVEL